MEQLRKTNAFMEKWIYVIMPLIMLLGLTSGQGLSAWTGWTSFLFMILTFISSMQADYRKFVLLFKKNRVSSFCSWQACIWLSHGPFFRSAA